MLGQDRLEMGDLAGARAAFDRADRIAAELDAPFLRVFASVSQAGLAALAGELDDAERLVADASALAQRIGIAAPGGPARAVLIERGLWERAVADLDALAEPARGMPVNDAALAMFHARLGNVDEARSQPADTSPRATSPTCRATSIGRPGWSCSPTPPPGCAMLMPRRASAISSSR